MNNFRFACYAVDFVFNASYISISFIVFTYFITTKLQQIIYWFQHSAKFFIGLTKSLSHTIHFVGTPIYSSSTLIYSSSTPIYSVGTPIYSSGTLKYSSGTPIYSSGTPIYSVGTPIYSFNKFRMFKYIYPYR